MEYIGLKTHFVAQKCFWWWVWVKRNKIVNEYQQKKSWVCYKHWYVLCRTTIFCRNFRNILLFGFVNIWKPQKLSARPNCFWELGSRVPPLVAALLEMANGHLMSWPASQKISANLQVLEYVCKVQKSRLIHIRLEQCKFIHVHMTVNEWANVLEAHTVPWCPLSIC